MIKDVGKLFGKQVIVSNTLSDTEIRKAVKALKSMEQVDTKNNVAWVHPRAYFRIQNMELCLAADKLNEKTGKDIWDKRTKGWKLIKPLYDKI